jgi:tetratricopeptide (TPR) repeat protein
MWTYLILLLGALAIVAVFVRRAILMSLKKKRIEAAANIEKVEEEIPVAAKLSKADKVEISDLLLQADELLKSGEEDEAIKIFVQALAIDENHPETQQKLAMLYLQKQMFGAASALFKQLALMTEDPIHYSHLGFSFYQQNAYEEAKEAYQKAVDLDPTRAKRFISLAQVYRSLGQHQNAIIALNKALELEKDNLEFSLLLAEIYTELNNLEEAVSTLMFILEKEPDHEEAATLLKKLKKETDGK